MDYCVVISCLDSHSDGTHSLQRINWQASDARLHLSKSVPTFTGNTVKKKKKNILRSPKNFLVNSS